MTKRRLTRTQKDTLTGAAVIAGGLTALAAGGIIGVLASSVVLGVLVGVLVIAAAVVVIAYIDAS